MPRKKRKNPGKRRTSSKSAGNIASPHSRSSSDSKQSREYIEKRILWNEKTEMMMRNLCELSHAHHLAHSDMFTVFQMRNRIIVNIVTAMGIIVSAGIFGSAPFCEESLWVQIVTGIINIITTYTARYQATSDYATNAQLHRYTSAKWNALYRNIESQLSYDPENRQDARDYIGWINAIYSDLCENSPDIIEKFRKKYKLTGADQINIVLP